MAHTSFDSARVDCHAVFDILLGFLWALIIAFAWPAIGTLVTFDDDLPGGWSNQDGSQKPHGLLLGLIGIEVLLLTIAMTWPNFAAFGFSKLIASFASH